MRAWVFQDSKQLDKHGAKKCPWSVGWLDSRSKRRQKTIGTKTAATQYARKIEGEAAAGLLTGTERVTWADFLERFHRDHTSTLAARSGEAYRVSLDAFERIIGPKHLGQVGETTVAEFTSARLREGVTPATVNRDLRHLRCALNKAKRWRLIPHPVEFDLLREPERDPEFVDDDTFAKLYAACETMKRPDHMNHAPAEWWRALLTMAYLTGWRIGEIMALRRGDVDWATGVAFIPAEKTKGKRDVRLELHPVALDHLKAIAGFGPLVFEWPHHRRTLWTDFARLKEAAGVSFKGAFHRFRFGFANANVDHIDADLLQALMRHKSASTTRRYVNAAERYKRQRVADRVHVPDFLADRQA